VRHDGTTADGQQRRATLLLDPLPVLDALAAEGSATVRARGALTRLEAELLATGALRAAAKTLRIACTRLRDAEDESGETEAGR